MSELSVVVPAWNEAERISPTLIALAEVMRSLQPPRSWELLVIDDGSTDETVRLCHALTGQIPELRVVQTSPNRGKGHAVRVGMREARGATRVMCDADGSMPATELPALLTAFASGEADVLIGSRYVEGAITEPQPLWRRTWSRWTNALARKVLAPGILDMHSGYKVFSAPAAEALFSRATVDGWAFDLEVLALAHRMGLRVKEAPIRWADDPRSKVNPLRDLGRVLHEAWMIKRRLDANEYALGSELGTGLRRLDEPARPS